MNGIAFDKYLFVLEACGFVFCAAMYSKKANSSFSVANNSRTEARVLSCRRRRRASQKVCKVSGDFPVLYDCMMTPM